MVAHHEVIALLHHLRTPVIVTAEVVADLVVAQRLIVDILGTVLTSNGVTFFCNHPLDEQHRRIA